MDLWRGPKSRPHGDIEIVVSTPGFRAVRECLADHIFYAASQGALRAIRDDAPPEAHQFWVLDPVASKWRLDVMVDPGDEHCWVYRRDPRIRAPREEMLAQSRDGIPYLCPAAVLLFKAKDPRPKDEIDFRNVADALSSSEREWLTQAIQIAHPASPWIARLSSE